jgi:hypothetical protein
MLMMITLSKRLKTGLIALGAVILVGATIPAAIWVTHTQSAKLENSRRRCQDSTEKITKHTAIIEHDKVTPSHINAMQCDTLTIINKDDKERLIAFGTHDNHISYDGVSEQTVERGQHITVTLITTGNYLFHDHFEDEVKGTFSVEN